MLANLVLTCTKFFNKKKPQVKLIKKGIDIGGIDTLVYCKSFPDKVILAGSDKIITIYDNSENFIVEC